jgi:hypothetical protein
MNAPFRRAIALAMLGLGACTRPADAPASALPPEELPDQETWGAVLRLSEGGSLRAVLAAPYMARFDRADSQVVHMGADPDGPDTSVVRATLYDASGAPRASIRARHLRFDQRARQFTARGAVSVRAPGGRSLDARSVSWSDEDERLRAPGAFRYESPTERISGVGLVASGDLSRYSFSRARGTVEVRE